MTDEIKSKLGNALDRFTGRSGTGTGRLATNKPVEDDFPAAFEKLKVSVIRPVFEMIGNGLAERGHEFNISEEPGGKISIHIVPAGVNKSIHAYDWFPTFSLFGSPFTKSVGVHGRNMRPNSDSGSGLRGDYKPAQLSREAVESELMKFIGEIANW